MKSLKVATFAQAIDNAGKRWNENIERKKKTRRKKNANRLKEEQRKNNREEMNSRPRSKMEIEIFSFVQQTNECLAFHNNSRQIHNGAGIYLRPKVGLNSNEETDKRETRTKSRNSSPNNHFFLLSRNNGKIQIACVSFEWSREGFVYPKRIAIY